MSETLFRTVGLIRSDESTGRTIHGLAVPYGQVIDVHEPGRTSYRESFRRGAFERTIQERGHKIRLMVGHDQRRLPIGRATELVETDEGLRVAFEIANTTAGNDALELARSGLAEAFSIGFRPMRQSKVDGVVVRTEVSLVEISLVSTPAYDSALVHGVRSADPDHAVATDVRRRRFELLLNT